MKLKKLLASFTAAALAVTTMAVTSFTASAADEVVASNVTVNSGTFKYGATNNNGSEGYSGVTVALKTETEALNCDDYEAVEMTYEASNWGNAKALALFVNDGTLSWQAVCTWQQDQGEKTIRYSFSNDTGKNFKQIGYQIVAPDFSKGSSEEQDQTFNGSITIKSIKLIAKDTVVYADQVVPVPDGDTFAGTFDSTKVNGYSAKIIVTYTASDNNNGIQFQDEDGNNLAQISGWGSTGELTKEILLSDFSSIPSKMKLNMWGVSSVSSIKIHNDSSKGNVYSEGGTTPGTASITLTPATLSVAVGESKNIIVTKVNADGYSFDVVQDYDTEVISAEIEATGSHVQVRGLKAGTTTVTVVGEKSGAADITATCAVTVTAAEVTPPPSGETTTLWSGTQAMAADWSASVQIEAAELSSLTAGGKLKVTYEAGADAQLSLKHKGDEWPGLPGFVAGDGGEWAAYNITGNGSYEYTLTAEDVALLKANGLAVSGKNYTLTKIEYIPAGGSGGDDEHTHTPASEWSHDGTNHWHACTGCDEKLDLAAHTYVSGSCSVCGAADPNAGSNPTPTPTPSPSPSVPSTAPNPAPVQQTTVVDTILATPDGSSSSVNLGASTKLDRVTVEAIATKGDVTIKFTVAGGAYWEINGKNITDAKGVDLGVRVNSKQIPESKVEAFAGEKTSIQLTLSHNGSLGFTGTLNVPVGNAHNGKYANLYYYHGGKFDFVGSSAISGGRTQFAFDHASNYLIVIDDYAYGEDVSSASGMTETTETSAVPYAAALVVIAAFGASAIVLKKRLSK